MARVYSSARGNQGVAPGMIFPFSRECQTVSVKNERVPGGYLRCDGSIYQARDYPELARVIGVGNSGGGGVAACRYPTGVVGGTLLNPTFDSDNNFINGTFAVPNLGAKVLVPSATAGQQFMGNTRMDGNGTYERAGIGYQAIIQNTVYSSFNGYVTTPGRTNTSLEGTPILQLSSTTTTPTSVDTSFTAGHTHGGGDNFNVTTTVNMGIDTDMQDNKDIYIEGVNVSTRTIDSSAASFSHNHQISGYGCTNNLEYTHPPQNISFAGTSAQAMVTADPREALDHVTTPYMILEYIIKF